MELLSPAGNFESLKAAIKSGADAIYCGGTQFSARRNAKNFTDEELQESIRLCHAHGVKLYVAVNILIKESELKDALNYTKFLIESGVDGIIIQDLGLMHYVRQQSSGIKLNASTQMTAASAEAVNFCANLGADRVVLARELSLKEIKSIKEKTDIELETFVHGALCMSWSGQCLLSSIIGGRSGNRGLCAQPCRLTYSLEKDSKTVAKDMPLLSPKDICLAEKLENLTGITDSLKIEGRMKSPEYTASVTALYKKALTGKISENDVAKTLSFFSRGGSSLGYFDGRTYDKMMDYQALEKISAERKDAVNLKDEDLSKRRKISFVLSADVSLPLHLSAQCDGFSAEAFGDVLEPARKDFDPERCQAQLEKLGDTGFISDKIRVTYTGNPFVPVSAINALRREVCKNLEEQICASYKKNAKIIEHLPSGRPKTKIPSLLIEVTTKEQLEAAKELGITDILTGYELSKETNADFVLCPAIKKEANVTDISAPRIMAQNIGQLKEKDKEIYGGERLNVTNSATCKVLHEQGVKRVTLSPELNLKEIREITKHTDVPTEVIAYGRLPVMVMENCVIKSQGLCSKSGGKFNLIDRKGERFPVLCEDCRNVLLNSVPTYMADKIDDLVISGVDVLRLKFTTETKEETKKVITAYKEALSGGQPKSIFERITRGHFYRGME